MVVMAVSVVQVVSVVLVPLVVQVASVDPAVRLLPEALVVTVELAAQVALV